MTAMPNSPLPVAGERLSDYRCVRCDERLRWSGAEQLRCSADGRTYPVVGGIPILTSRPEGLIRASCACLERARGNLLRDTAAARIDASSARPEKQRRVDRAILGMELNLAAVGGAMQPAFDHLRATEVPMDLLDQISNPEAQRSPPWWMLDYFYQDWAGTKDFEDVRKAIEDSVIRHRPDDASLAVLGTGAAGLVRTASRLFRETYAVDLSLPTMLLAKTMLSGGALRVAVERADWCSLTLGPGQDYLCADQQARHGVHLLIGDVNWLPLASGTVSVIVTQYLLDIVGDALKVATEIRRVLRPDGIWVNFSNPLVEPGAAKRLGRPTILEMPEIMRPLGFEVLDPQRRNFAWLNVDGLTPYGDRAVQDVHLFTARKRPLPDNQEQRLLAERFATWETIPRRIGSRDVHLSTRRTIAPSGEVRETFEVGLDAFGSLPVDGKHAAFFERLFALVDGERTLRQIYAAISGMPPHVSEQAFLELFDYIGRSYRIIDLSKESSYDHR